VRRRRRRRRRRRQRKRKRRRVFFCVAGKCSAERRAPRL